MMEWIIPVLGAAASGCLVWLLADFYSGRKVRSHRVESMTGPGIQMPYPVSGKKGLFSSQREVIFGKIQHDRISRDLFIVGLRKQRQHYFYRRLFQVAAWSPVLFFVFLALKEPLGSGVVFKALLFGGALYGFLRLNLRARKLKIQKKMLKTLPEFLDFLIVCLEAGLNFTAALPKVLEKSDKKDPLLKEFEVMHNEYLGGLSFSRACERLASRCPLPELAALLNAMIQSERMGSSLADSLRIQAAELRDKYRQRIREKAYRISVKLVFPVMLIVAGCVFPITAGPMLYKLVVAFGAFQEIGGPKDKQADSLYRPPRLETSRTSRNAASSQK